MKKALSLSLALMLCMALAVPMASAADQPTAEEVYSAIIAMKGQYPEGTRWTNDNEYDWKGGIFSGGGGCAGFAFLLSDAAFGDFPARMLETFSYDDVRVGDILRVNGDTHSVVVLEVHPDHVVITEGNFNSSIHWGRTLTKSAVEKATYLITRYPEASAEPAPETPAVPASNAAERTLLPEKISYQFDSLKKVKQDFTAYSGAWAIDQDTSAYEDNSYDVVTAGTKFTITNISANPNDIVAVTCYPFVWSDPKSIPADRLAEVSEEYELTGPFRTGYLWDGPNEGSYSLHQDGWEYCYYGIDTQINAGVEGIKHGESRTFTLPDAGKDKFYQIIIYVWDEVNDPDGADYFWQENFFLYDGVSFHEDSNQTFDPSAPVTPATPAVPAVTVEDIPASGTAIASTQSVTVDGKKTEFQMYALADANGNRTNYIKLRDMAQVLNGTKAQFSVGYDSASSTISVTSGEAYVSNGSEMTTPFSGDRAYTGGAKAVQVNGSAVNMTAITLVDDAGGGYNYFKLRDLGKALGFNVGYSNEQGVYIESDKPYVG